MTHEINKRTDHYSREIRLRYTCGWTTQELAWQAESSRRMWAKEHDQMRTYREWIGKHLKNEVCSNHCFFHILLP